MILKLLSIQSRDGRTGDIGSTAAIQARREYICRLRAEIVVYELLLA